MSNRRVKNVDYDDDDGYDSYEEEYDEGQEELTEEDREQLQTGTAKVKSLLGPQATVTDKEIQDALWNYYYDVDKSVAYLKNIRKPKQAQQKHAQPKPTQQKPKGHSTNDPRVLPSLPKVAGRAGHSSLLGIAPSRNYAEMDFEEFFADTPWGNVPVHRLGQISHAPMLPKGRLLGGSSKLAALAAARKKKAAEKAAAASGVSNDRSIDLLDRLGKDKTATVDGPAQPRTMTFPTRQKKPSAPEPTQAPEVASDSPKSKVAHENLKASPSIFAETLLGGNVSEVQEGVALQANNLENESDESGKRTFQLPYMADTDFVQRDPFTKPSPDDVVLRAQGKDS